MVLKELIFNSFHLGGCGGLESTDFKQFLLWAGYVMVLKELIFQQFLLWEGVVVLERTDF